MRTQESEPHIVAIINDCRDDNAVARQQARVANLFDATQTYVGVDKELEASGNLVDLLQETGGERAIILVNDSPRNGESKRHKNGPPFGYFWYEDTLVVSSTGGLVLSLPKKLGITAVVNELDIETTIEEVLRETGESNKPGLAKDIINTPFRSLMFLPRVARALWNGANLPSEEKTIESTLGRGARGWSVDNFGNVKTTALPEEIGFDPKAGDGYRVNTILGELSCYAQLSYIPDGELAVTVGSSGFGENKFLEFKLQGGSAAKQFGSNHRIFETNLFRSIS